ncbi:MAG: hypothetical protein JW814_12450 [Candidatus Krumholzibacteriota bacterium]|nr:hypothetical protein [Candidatus Krumholzibacteriota bacterium]
MKTKLILLPAILVLFSTIYPAVSSRASTDIDPYEMIDACGRFPFAKVIPLDNGEAWGMIYADVYGKIYLKRWTSKGWKQEWELTNLGSKVRKFFITDVEGDGRDDIVIATVSGRILTYSMNGYINTWENIEDDFTSIEAIELGNIDSDPQVEFIVIAGGTMYIIDGVDKSRQWISERKFKAAEIVIANVDSDDAMEIILNTGIIIDSKFRNIELEWDKSFGDRITVFDMNNDGYPEVIGEFTDYSLRIFDIYSEREVW